MLIDILIVLFVISSVIRNWGSGFLRQIWSVGGFFGGIFLGRLLESYTIGLVHTPASRAVITISTIFGMALLGLSIGEGIGIRLKHRWIGTRFNPIDNALGSVLSVLSILLSAWLIAAVISSLPATKIKTYIQKSHIISALNRVMPPAPNLISDLGKLIDPNGFPDVFIGNEPIPRGNVNLPSLGALASAVNKDRLSVVRIEGYGCGGIISGSG